MVLLSAAPVEDNAGGSDDRDPVQEMFDHGGQTEMVYPGGFYPLKLRIADMVSHQRRCAKDRRT